MQGNLLARLGTTTLGATKTQARTERVNSTQLGPVTNPPVKTQPVNSSQLSTISKTPTATPDKTDTRLGPVVNNVTTPTVQTPSRLEAGTNSNYLASAFQAGTTLTGKTNASLYKPTKTVRPFSPGGGFTGGQAPLQILPSTPTADVMLINSNDELLENPTDKFLI